MKKIFKLVLPLSVISLVATGLSLSTVKFQYKRVLAGEIGDYGDATRLQSMTFYGDTKTQMGFCWTTTNATSTDLQVLEKSIYDNSTGFDDPIVENSIKYYTGTIEVSPIAGDGFIHRAAAKRLTPDTEYVYRFGDEQLNRWCEVGSFKTSANNNRNFSFLHISDPQGDNELHYESYNQLLTDMQVKCEPEWIALTGDITDDSHFGGTIDLHEWELALTEQWSVFKDYPVAAVSGNHDGALHAFHSRFNYNIPSGSDTSAGDYYSFDYQGVHFTCINSNDTPNPKDPNTTGISETQLNWIKDDLAAHKNDKFLIVMIHKGLFDSGGHSCNNDRSDYDIEQMRRQLCPLFTEYGVDLVLQGHDHLYSLSYPMVADEYVGQENYYRVDSGYKYSYRNYGTEEDYQNVYTFSNLKGTFYFNTGTASGQKYYAPIVGGELEDYIFDTSNPNQKMFTMVEVLDEAIILKTYTSTSTKTELYNIYAIAKDSEGTPAQEQSEYNTDFEIEGNYSFNYLFSRYNHTSNVVMKSQKLINAEADLAGKFIGTFTCDGGVGTSICQLYRTGKVVMNTELVFENEKVTFATEGSWHMENNELLITIVDEKGTNVNHRATISNIKKTNTGLILGLSIPGGIAVIGGIVVAILFYMKKKKAQ